MEYRIKEQIKQAHQRFQVLSRKLDLHASKLECEEELKKVSNILLNIQELLNTREGLDSLDSFVKGEENE